MATEMKVGQRRLAPNGYLYEKLPNGEWELVSRIIAAEKLGRPLASDEYASYKDGDRKNLDPSNIIVKKRGKTSMRKRLAVVEDRIRELEAEREELRRKIGEDI